MAKTPGVAITEVHKKLSFMSFNMPPPDIAVVDLAVDLDQDTSPAEMCAGKRRAKAR